MNRSKIIFALFILCPVMGLAHGGNGSSDTTPRDSIHALQLKEVVVTAKESQGLSSSSKINRQAMEHIQPSSISDLLALLPGGKTSDPDFSTPSHISLREAGISSNDYNTHSLGTRFVMDGAPIITDASMQRVRTEINTLYGYKNSTNAGVDMRNIPTDNIESVEVVRGIPSVKYGEATSGLILIKRKMRATPFEARLKADFYGKLLSATKGIEFEDHNTTLMADIGWMDSRFDPRDRYGNFQRFNTSVRLSKGWVSGWRWNASADYTGNIDSEKNDPDIENQQEDSYRSSYHSLSFKNELRWNPGSDIWLKSVELLVSSSITFDKIKRSRFIQLDRDRVIVNNYDAGEHDGLFLPYKYVAQLEVDGKPFSMFATLDANLRGHTGNITHAISGGLDWQMSKNYGKGEIYDLTRPLNPYSSSARPRKFSDIPAQHLLSLYAQDEASFPFGKNEITLQAGIRMSSMPGLSSRYAMHGKAYIDPRANLQWKITRLDILGKPLELSLTGGIGIMTKMPTISMFYPAPLYIDFTQLNYWHPDPQLRKINVLTYKEDPTNYDIKPARNLKKEIRLGIDIDGNYLSATYFHEDMKSGFRSEYICRPYIYKKYDSGAIDGNTITSPPALDDMPWTPDTLLSMYGHPTNGSRTVKRGVEFQLSTKRFRSINTRLTISGAWFKTLYENSSATFQSSNSTAIIGGVNVNDKYMGYYEWEDRYIREQFNTNFTVDTDLPRLGMRFSITAECTWFTSSQMGHMNGTPTAYMDVTGTLHPFRPEDADDAWLQHLIKRYNDLSFKRTVNPFYMYVNFKATKQFGKRLRLALFIDRLIDCVNDFTRNGMIVRRTAQNPYFGMELNLSI